RAARSPSHRICAARQHRGCRRAAGSRVPAGASGYPRAPLDGRVDRGRRDRAASAEYRATAQRDREPFRAADGERSTPMTLVAVLGAGSWGTTLANLLALKGDT